MTLKDKILAIDDYQYLKTGPERKENVRNAYEVALELDGKPMDYKEPNDDMFNRVGRFCWLYAATLNDIACDIHNEFGLVGGATGGASISDVQHLSAEAALKLFNITYAEHEAERLKPVGCPSNYGRSS